MTDFRVFYRIIGIADHIVRPSYYHLLGLQMQGCTAEKVRQALVAKKNELRQNVPGQEFVPMVLKFEKEQLEPAARVLADEARRAEYNKQLGIIWEKFKHENEKRSNLIEGVRQAVTMAVDENGTLGSDGRRKLASELAEIGVEKSNIETILERIPRPLSETGQHPAVNQEFFEDSVKLAADDGIIDKGEHKRLIDLAAVLNIDMQKAESSMELLFTDEDNARLDQQVESYGAVLDDEDCHGQTAGQDRVDSACAVNDAEGSTPEDIESVDHLSDRQAIQLLEEFDKDKHPVERKIEIKWARMLNFVVPVVVLAIFGIVLLFFAALQNGQLRKRFETDTDKGPSVRKVAAEPETDVEEQAQAGDKPSENTADIPSSPAVDPAAAKKTVNDARQPAAGRVDKTAAGSQISVIQLSVNPSDVVKVLAGYDFTVLSIEDLLADSALGMLACCDRAGIMVLGSYSYRQELVDVLNSTDRADLFASVATDDGGRFSCISGQDKDDDGRGHADKYARLKKDLESSDRLVRYKAIDQLQADAGVEAVEILLGDLNNPFVGSKQTISRRLRALSRIATPYIAGEIALRIGTCPRAATAQQLSLALIDMTSIVPEGSGILAAKNDYSQRQNCSQWWSGRLNSWSPPRPDGFENMVDKQMLENIERPGKLIAALAFYAQSTAEQLVEQPGPGRVYDVNDITVTNWTDTAVVTLSEDIIADANVVESVLDNATGNIADELERMIRVSPKVKNYLLQLDIIKLERNAARLGAESDLQKAAVNIHTAARLLDILVRLEYPDRRYETELDNIRRQRLKDLQRVSNVFQEIRQQVYHNVRLFDLLAGQI